MRSLAQPAQRKAFKQTSIRYNNGSLSLPLFLRALHSTFGHGEPGTRVLALLVQLLPDSARRHELLAVLQCREK